MAKRQQNAKSVFSQFVRLSWDQQVAFLELAHWEDGDNPIKRMMAVLDQAGLGEATAMREALIADMKLDRMKRKPNRDAAAEVIRLREVDGLSFGQIAKRLELKNEATARQRYNRAKQRQQQT